ncbi:MAG: ABC transporter permease [Lachnospirales bacterium]
MNNIFTVFEYEFLGFIKDKKNWITTIIMLVVGILIAVLPLIIQFFSNDKEEQGDKYGVYVENQNIVDMEKYLVDKDDVTFTFVDSYDELIEGISNSKFNKGVYFSSNNPIVYTESLSITTIEDVDSFFDDINESFTNDFLEEMGLLEEIEDFSSYINSYDLEKYDITDGEFTLNENRSEDLYIQVMFAYFFVILVYIMSSQYGSYCAMSIANEKTSRTMESLISATDTNSLVFGKVLAVFVGSIIQFLLIIGILIVSSNIGLSGFSNLTSEVTELSNAEMMYSGIATEMLNFNNLIYFSFLSIFGFLMFLFVYAVLASTVSKIEEISSSFQLGNLIFMGAFFVAMFLIISPENKILNALVYIPLFTPLAMISKYAGGLATNFDIIYSIVISIIDVVVLGIFASRSYKVGVLYYGSKPSVKKLFTMFIFNK